MALITRLQWTLLRLGLAHTWAQALFVAVVMLATLFGVLRQDSMDVLAKASSSHSFPAALGMAPSLAWDTVYDHDRMAQQAHAETMALLRATDPRFAKNINAQRQRQLSSSAGGSENGENLFLETYRLQSEGQYAQALQVAQTMVDRFPHFQLGQLVYADLLASLTPGSTERESLLNNTKTQERLSQLKTEALQRTRHAGTQGLPGSLPEPLRYLSPNVPQVVVVDAHKSRLYLLARRHDGAGLDQLSVIFDAYISIGNKGIGKWREGDAKTPTGVYFVQKHMTDPMLPDLYGSGALTLDYPNLLDTQQQRTGSGIWLHGSPSQQYARPPTATDGCVVLANDDMLQLVKHGVRAGTPVIIAEQLTWQSPSQRSGMFQPSNITDAANSWPQPQHSQQTGADWTLLSAFEWTDQKRQVAVLSHELQTPGQSTQRRNSYWVKDQQQWKEVVGPLSAQVVGSSREARTFNERVNFVQR